MRIPIAAIAVALLASGCGVSNIQEQQEERQASDQVIPAPGAPVSELRKVAASPAPSPNRYELLGGAELEVNHTTLVDVGTGCQYTMRVLYQQEVDLSPRNEPSPEGSIQRCGAPRPGSTDFVSLKGGSVSAVRVAVVVDRETGCQEIVGTLFQDAMFVTPRMEAVDGARRQVCRRN